MSEQSQTMQWTTKPPTQEGWYWAQVDEISTIVKVEKDAFTGEFCVSHVGHLGEYSLSDYQLWFGPLTPPVHAS